MTAIAVIALAVLAVVNVPGSYSPSEKSKMASKFDFQQLPLSSASKAPERSVYTVEPAVQKIRSWISALGAAVSLTDADGDGLANDYCLVDPRTRSVTVAPAPGTGARYQPFLLGAGPLRYDRTMTPMGCYPGDFNEDGLTDFLVPYTGRTPILYIHQPNAKPGASAFKPQELVPGSQQRWVSDTATLADVDGDGHVDILLGNYFRDGVRLLDPSAKSDPRLQMADSLSRANNGGGLRIFLSHPVMRDGRLSANFQEAKNVLKPGDAHGWSVAIGAVDFTGDLLPDIYVADDFGPDHLFVNQSTPGHVKLTPVTGRRGFFQPESKVLGHDSFKSMAAGVGDLNGDGRLDMFVTNITSEFGLQESNFAWINNGKPLKPGAPAPFSDKSESLGLSRSGWGWDAKVGDFDNDGKPEIVQTAGYIKGHTNRWPELHELAFSNDNSLKHVASWPSFQPGTDISGHEHDAFWVRGPSGRYANLGKQVGLGAPMVSRGVALGDVNGDGKLDFGLANQWGPSYLYENRAGGGPFLGLDLRLPPAGKKSATRFLPFPPRGIAARPAIGAEVTIALPNGRKLVQQVYGTNGHAGASAQQLIFGLGKNPPSQVVANVAWRDGTGVRHHASFKLRPGWHAVLLEER